MTPSPPGAESSIRTFSNEPPSSFKKTGEVSAVVGAADNSGENRGSVPDPVLNALPGVGTIARPFKSQSSLLNTVDERRTPETHRDRISTDRYHRARVAARAVRHAHCQGPRSCERSDRPRRVDRAGVRDCFRASEKIGQRHASSVGVVRERTTRVMQACRFRPQGTGSSHE